MLPIFRTVVERLKALFAAAAAQELEAEALARHAERKAELLRLAGRYDAEGPAGVADDLRRLSGAVDWARPLAGVPDTPDRPAGGADTPALPPTATNGRKKAGRG